MKKLLLLLTTALLFTGCASSVSDETSDEMPENFNICYQYWIGARNVLDTYEGYLQKDLVTLDPVRTDFSITDEEKQAIYDKLIEFDIVSIDREITSKVLTTDDIMVEVEPCTYYDIRFTIGENEYQITGDESGRGYRETEEDAGNFFEFVSFMNNFIYSSDEYKSLPEAEGAYE